MPFVNVSDDIRLHYEDEGDGTPVLLVHGWLETPRADLWPLVTWLAESYRVIAPTRRGYGESRPPQRDYPDDFYHRDAADMLALLDELNIEKAHILGFSDGGETVLIMAGLQPERFHSVTAWGAVGYFGAEMRPHAQRSAPATFLINDPELMARHGITDPKAHVAGWIRAVVRMIDRGGDVSLSLAPHITCPLQILLGDKDSLNPQSYGQRFVDSTPNGRLMMFKDTDHGIHTERPEAFRKTVGEFLKANTPTA